MLKKMLLAVTFSFIIGTGICQESDLLQKAFLLPEEVPVIASEVTFLDVRTDKEWELGHIHGAIHLELKKVRKEIEMTLRDKSKAVVVYCGTGPRAQAAAKFMNSIGYRAIPVTRGGFMQLVAAGLSKE